MEIESPSNQEVEFRILLSQNEDAYKSKAEGLMKKVESLLSYSNEVSLLENIHLTDAISFMNKTIEKKKEESDLISHEEEEEIDLEIEDEVRKQIVILNDEINILNQEYSTINENNNKTQLANKLITKQILDIELNMFNNPNNIYLSSLNKTNEIGPDLSFVYEKSANGSIHFKNDYKSIVNHYFKRLEENKEIIDRLEKLVIDKVVQQETQAIKIEHIKSVEIQLAQTQSNSSRIKSEIERSKEKLKLAVQEKYEEIEKRLPEEIDRGVKEFVIKNSSYENTYRRLLEIVKTVISDSNIKTVSDNLRKVE